MKEGAEALGWHFTTVVRNADASAYSPETAAYMGFGDQSGSKQSTTKTFLRDAVEAGAEVLARTTAQRILVEGGRAAGVEAVYLDPASGRSATVTVRAPQVVVACGSLESPALLLRSQIGGPAVGDYLRLHPCTAFIGIYHEDQRAWWGPPHSGVVDEFADTGDGWGFLLETAQYTTGIGASAIPFTSAAEHKQALADFRCGATSIALLRDRGHGRVTIDAEGQAAAPLRAHRRGRHRATPGRASTRRRGCTRRREPARSASSPPGCRAGAAATTSTPSSAPPSGCRCASAGYKLFSAHQMGSCRMGTDPETSVAGPWGELHDTPGVWIGDASAFPTSSRNQPDDLDHGPRPPHRGGDRRRLPGHRRGGAGGSRQLSDERSRWQPRLKPSPVSSSSSAASGSTPPGRNRSRSSTRRPRRRWGRSRRERPRTSTGRLLLRATAFEAWSQTSREERADYLGAIAAGLTERGDEIAATISQELGMPVKLSRMIQAGLPTMSFGSMPQLIGEVAWEERVGNSLIVREAAGVVGAITPWNYPLHQIAAKVAPALAAGCTVVCKPSEVVPLNAFILAEVIEAAGLPAGVFNLVTGTGPVVGEAIAAHPQVDMVSFTGSTRAGRRVSELASATVKPVAMELGGKSPNVILDDADLEAAVPDGVGKCFLNSGQTCSALTRMLVPRERLGEAEAIAAAAAEQFVPGDPFEPTTRLGPLVSDIQRDRVRGYIEQGRGRGREAADRRQRAAGGPRSRLLRAPDRLHRASSLEMTIAQEEIFGPVLSILPYEDTDDAIRIANDSQYGLAGGVWSGDEERAKSVARRIRTGQVEINGGVFNPLAPFGGYKQSGHGRELGRHGIEEYLQVKSLQL